ncbi:Rho GTPase-activating protein 26 [Trichoplax sp. H2]|nr:Rho GTPase-activating protein 26 [Trichoplax sp. H2]|eukprot:RDD37864.1 Rho GTPase-activating protein 26 [Trichoplax sp. H2]
MVLLPLEPAECLTDSPYFRSNLHSHEGELEDTSDALKGLLKESRKLLSAITQLSKAQKSFALALYEFKFTEAIGQPTDDELTIAEAFKSFSKMIRSIEDAREGLMTTCNLSLLQPLENFRKEDIEAMKEEKKKYEKSSQSYYNALEKHLNISNKKKEAVVQESEDLLDHQLEEYHQASLDYVFQLYQLQEMKKFQFVEIVRIAPLLDGCTFSGRFITKARQNFDTQKEEAQSYITKIRSNADKKIKSTDDTREGYLYMLKKGLVGGNNWVKYYCLYEKKGKLFKIISSSQNKVPTCETMKVMSCVRRKTDSIEKRYCFDITFKQETKIVNHTFQCLGEDDRRSWLEAMDGAEPVYSEVKPQRKTVGYELNENGFAFVERCIEEVEKRGLGEQGLYRLVGSTIKVKALLQAWIEGNHSGDIDYSEYPTSTITSSLKKYLRSMPEPLTTHMLHSTFIKACKIAIIAESDTLEERVDGVRAAVEKLPELNYNMLYIVVAHLKNVAGEADVNKMYASNLGVVFGPTLMRPEEESMAAIVDIKYQGVCVEIMVSSFDKVFKRNVTNAKGPFSLTPTFGKRSEDNSVSRKPSSLSVTARPDDIAKNRKASTPVGRRKEVIPPIKQHSSPNIGARRAAISRKPSPNTGGTPLVAQFEHQGQGNITGQRQSPSTSQPPSLQPSGQKLGFKVARTLYQCKGEYDKELSFEANQVIHNVRESEEPGWLYGTINDETGLIPENYVEIIN